MLKRTQFLRKAEPNARASVPVFKKKACKECKAKFTPTRPMQPVCANLECAISYADKTLAKGRAKLAKEVEKAARAEKRAHREKLDDSKKLSHWLELTKTVVHRYIRARDAHLTCISCGTSKTVQWEAGHWLSVGARPELRYDPANINKQCHRCNVQLSGNQAAYRIGLVEKIGLAEVERLEGPHPVAKFTREELAAIRKEFAAMTRNLEKSNVDFDSHDHDIRARRG